MTPDDPRPRPPQPAPGPEPGSAHPPAGGADALDDLASAALDGVLGGEEDAAARRRPEVMARVAEMAAAREALRAVPPPGPDARARALAAALSAYDEVGAAAPADRAGGADVARLRSGTGRPPSTRPDVATRPAWRDRGRGAERWLRAAAAVAVLAAGATSLALIGSAGDNDGGDDAAMDDAAGGSQAEAPSTAVDEEGEQAREAAPEDGDSLATDHSLPADVGDLGTFASGADLVEAVQGQPAATAAAGADEGSGDAGAASPPSTLSTLDALGIACGGATPPQLEGDLEISLHGRAVVGGQQVDVLVVRTPEGSRVVALDPGCGVVVDEPLD